MTNSPSRDGMGSATALASMDSTPSVPPPVPSGPPPVPPARPAVAAWRWWIHLLVIGSYPVLIGVLSLFQPEGASSGPALGTSVAELLWVSAVTLGTFGIIFALGWAASRATADDLRLRWRSGWWPWPLGLAYSVGLRLLAGLAVLALAGVLMLTGQVKREEFSDFITDNRPQVEAVVSVGSLADNPVYYVLSLTLISFVVAGLREELWRSATFAALEKLFPLWGARWSGKAAFVLLTALVFGLGHLPQGWLAVMLTGVLGLGLGTIIMVHRSIWTAVIAHGFFDAVSLALLPYVPKILEAAQKMQAQP